MPPTGLEPVEQSAQIVPFHFGPVVLTGPAADFIHQILGTARSIGAAQQILVGAQLATLAALAAQGIPLKTVALALCGLALVLVFAGLALALGQGAAQFLQAVAQRVHGAGLVIQCAAEVAIGQVPFGFAHGALGSAQGITGGVAALTSSAGEVVTQLLQLLAQRFLALSQGAGVRFCAWLVLRA